MSGASATPPVFLADRASLEQDTVILAGPEGRHAATVRRLRPGERADLTDGAGLIAECVVTAGSSGSSGSSRSSGASGSGQLEFTVLSRTYQPPPEPRICVVQAVPKGDRAEQAVETMTEVGVDVIMPWAAERCVAVWAGGHSGHGGRDGRDQEARTERALERWRTTAREAAKQSRRAWLPEVTPLASTATVAERCGSAACAVTLDPGADTALGALPVPPSGEIVVIVGPEGGLSAAELIGFEQAGTIPARLGPTVLRSSTAGATAAAILLSRSARW